MKKVLISLLVVCLIFTAAGCSCRINIKTGEKDSAIESSPEISGSESDEESESVDEANNSGGNSSYSGGSYNGGIALHSWEAAPAVTIPAEIPTISFPYEISDTGLIIQQVSSYSGYFIEDVSDREVSGITAIVLTNNGGDLDFVGIGIAQGKRNLAFSGSQIPAGATVIIQEQTGAAFTADPFYSATATTTPAVFEKSEDLVKIQDNGNGTFSVINISEETLSEVKVYFKNYIPEENIYVGGITYSVTLENIEPETAIEVSASHYDPNYTVFVEINVVK